MQIQAPTLLVILALAFAPATGSALPDGLARDYFQFRYYSDPEVPVVPPPAAFCADAPFVANAYLEGPLLTYKLSSITGRVKREPLLAVGHVRMCVAMLDFTFTPGQVLPIYWELVLDGIGIVRGDGACLPSSNDSPQPGVVLGGCALAVTSAPAPYTGGNMGASGNLLNPYGVPGFEKSSSFLTVQLFRPADGSDPAPDEPVDPDSAG